MCVHTEVVLQEVTSEDAVLLQRWAPNQQNGVFLRVGGSQDVHLLGNYKNDGNVNVSTG